MMYTVGELIQQLGVYDEDLTVEVVLEKEEASIFLSSRTKADALKFARLLQGIYTSLPAKSKSTAHRIFRRTNGTKKKNIRSAAVTAVLEIRAIALPKEIHNLFQTWEESPSQFWKGDGTQLEACWESRGSIERIATEAYLIVRQLGQRRMLDTILWRFYVYFFYSLALLLGDGQLNMSNGLYQRLLAALLQSKQVTDDAATIEENLLAWKAAGSKYHKICLRLGQGALFLLPQVSDGV